MEKLRKYINSIREKTKKFPGDRHSKKRIKRALKNTIEVLKRNYGNKEFSYIQNLEELQDKKIK